MARYDKYDPYDGGFRGPLNAAVAASAGFDLVGVGVNSSGRVVIGAGNTGIIGVMVAHGAKKIGDIADIMTDGEIVEVKEDGLDATATVAPAGTKFYVVPSTGAVTATASTGADETLVEHVYIGHTVEAGRLIVRVAR